MIKNNLLCFFAHIIYIVLSIVIAAIFNVNLPNWAILAIGSSIYLLFMYIIVGTKLTPQKSDVRNIFSVSIISIIGLIIFGVSLFSKNNETKGLLQFFLPVINMIEMVPNDIEKGIIDNSWFLFCFSLVPTILLWLGLQIKAKKILDRFQHINRFIHLFLFIFIAAIILNNLFTGKYESICFSNKGDKIFVEKNYSGNYRLYFCDLTLKK